jgi:hydroxyacylglutathione hydrolase
MDRNRTVWFALIVVVIYSASCTKSGGLTIRHQAMPPPLATNCYLLYDEASGEAALVDVGGPIDTLTTFIEEHGLKLKYIFITHCHADHVYGLPAVTSRYPEAAVCMTKADFDDAGMYTQWEQKLPPDEVAAIAQSPELVELMNFDISRVCVPDVFLEDNQTCMIGNVAIKAILTPGHSRGGVSFYAENALFSGDALFYRTVGRTDVEGMSWDTLLVSVRKLYLLLPDETVVYPGHGQFTTIGDEKKFNARISADKPTEQ